MKSNKMKIIYMTLSLGVFLGCSSMSTAQQAMTPTKEEKEEYVANNDYRLNENFCEYIMKGYIELGMTKEDVKVSWGQPRAIKQRKSGGYDEVWVYIPNWKFKNKLFFNQGILVKTEPYYLVISKMRGHGRHD